VDETIKHISCVVFQSCYPSLEQGSRSRGFQTYSHLFKEVKPWICLMGSLNAFYYCSLHCRLILSSFLNHLFLNLHCCLSFLYLCLALVMVVITVNFPHHHYQQSLAWLTYHPQKLYLQYDQDIFLRIHYKSYLF
jgi:hypothetical protein